MRAWTNDDLNAAIRGLGMWGMTRTELRALREEVTSDLFAARVIREAATQVLRAKAWLNAE